MKFTKMQGAGNDFVLIETGDTQSDWGDLAKAMCDRHYGIGADGLLVLLPSTVADFRMRMFNPDGSESDACGNGLRCMVKHFLDGGLTNSAGREVSVETVAGIRRAEVSKSNGREARVRTGMGAPGFRKEDIPAVLQDGAGNIVDIKSMITYSIILDDTELPLSLVSMGNPHAVYFSQEPLPVFPLASLGPRVERHEIFPKGVNFEVARVLDRQQIEARVWERAAGETLACGSGACAITVAARKYGYVNNKVNIKLPGGTLEVEWDGVGEVFLSGPAETVFSGEWMDETHC